MYVRLVPDSPWLTAELLAPGLVLDETERRQRQSLTARSLRFKWTCFFKESATYHMSVVFRCGVDSGDELGRWDRSVRVVKIDHLSQGQVYVAGAISAIVTFAIALLGLPKVVRELRTTL